MSLLVTLFVSAHDFGTLTVVVPTFSGHLQQWSLLLGSAIGTAPASRDRTCGFEHQRLLTVVTNQIEQERFSSELGSMLDSRCRPTSAGCETEVNMSRQHARQHGAILRNGHVVNVGTNCAAKPYMGFQVLTLRQVMLRSNESERALPNEAAAAQLFEAMLRDGNRSMQMRGGWDVPPIERSGKYWLLNMKAMYGCTSIAPRATARDYCFVLDSDSLVLNTDGLCRVSCLSFPST